MRRSSWVIVTSLLAATCASAAQVEEVALDEPAAAVRAGSSQPPTDPLAPESPFQGTGRGQVTFGGVTVEVDGVFCSTNGLLFQLFVETPPGSPFSTLRAVSGGETTVTVTDEATAAWTSNDDIVVVDGDQVTISGAMMRGAESVGIDAAVDCNLTR